MHRFDGGAVLRLTHQLLIFLRRARPDFLQRRFAVLLGVRYQLPRFRLGLRNPSLSFPFRFGHSLDSFQGHLLSPSLWNFDVPPPVSAPYRKGFPILTQ